MFSENSHKYVSISCLASDEHQLLYTNNSMKQHQQLHMGERSNISQAT